MMGKLLRPQDRILLGLAILGDVFEEVRLVGGFVPSAYKEMYGFVPEKYKKANFYTRVSRAFRTGLIERVIVDGEPRFRLTSSGKTKLVRNFPLLSLQNQKWDRKWRVLIFDVPEKERKRRDILREKARELGFGMVQQSVWISPHPFEEDIREFLINQGFGEEAFVIVSGRVFFGDSKELAGHIWNLDEVNASYKEAIEEFTKELRKGDRKFLSRFAELMSQDPFLPKELLPVPWWADKARDIVKNIVKGTNLGE